MLLLVLLLILIHSLLSCEIPYCDTCSGGTCVKCIAPYSVSSIGTCLGPPCLNIHCSLCDYGQFYCVQCAPLYEVTREEGCKISRYVIITPICVCVVGIVLTIFYCVVKLYHRRLRRRALEELYQQERLTLPAPVATCDHILDNPGFKFDYDSSKSFCPVCLEGNCNLITCCGHYFHVQCFSNWIRRHKICPTCNNKEVDLVIVVLCLKCKRRYHHYETYINFVMQVTVDMAKPCTTCNKGALQGEQQGREIEGDPKEEKRGEIEGPVSSSWFIANSS